MLPFVEVLLEHTLGTQLRTGENLLCGKLRLRMDAASPNLCRWCNNLEGPNLETDVTQAAKRGRDADDKRIPCPHCERTFASHSGRNYHIKTCHPTEAFARNWCVSTFTTAKSRAAQMGHCTANPQSRARKRERPGAPDPVDERLLCPEETLHHLFYECPGPRQEALRKFMRVPPPPLPDVAFSRQLPCWAIEVYRVLRPGV